eukprot:g63747.t1
MEQEEGEKVRKGKGPGFGDPDGEKEEMSDGDVEGAVRVAPFPCIFLAYSKNNERRLNVVTPRAGGFGTPKAFAVPGGQKIVKFANGAQIASVSHRANLFWIPCVAFAQACDRTLIKVKTFFRNTSKSLRGERHESNPRFGAVEGLAHRTILTAEVVLVLVLSLGSMTATMISRYRPLAGLYTDSQNLTEVTKQSNKTHGLVP